MGVINYTFWFNNDIDEGRSQMIQITIALVGIFVFTLAFAAAVFTVEEIYGELPPKDKK